MSLSSFRASLAGYKKPLEPDRHVKKIQLLVVTTLCTQFFESLLCYFVYLLLLLCSSITHSSISQAATN